MINKHLITTKHQSGVVLVISLIMLLALTLIGVTSSSVTGLEEKMSANTKDMNLAFQAAEAALRDAENNLTAQPVFTRGTSNSNQGTGGYYSLLNNDETMIPQQKDPSPRVTQPQNDTTVNSLPFYSSVDWYGTKVMTYPKNGANSLVGLSHPPVYIIEELSSKFSGSAAATGGAGSSLGGGSSAISKPKTSRDLIYRITAHGWGSNANSVVTVQSTNKATYPI
jgi:type IV pilus assembly protein PilX